MNKNFVFDESNINRLFGSLGGGCALTVGSFDGVHIGHRRLLSALSAAASDLGVPSVVLTFPPCDSPKPSSALLTQPAVKYRLLAENGASAAVELPYGKIKDFSASDFVNEWLIKRFKAKYVVCGDDFRFGSGRSGGAETLGSLLAEHGVELKVIPPVFLNGEKVSSTRVRMLVSSGDICAANEMLGRAYSFESVVVRGAGIAEKMGYPTANMFFPQELALPSPGVYAARFRFPGGDHPAVLNIGVKPTFPGNHCVICESHLFGFNGDLYGKAAEVRFLKHFRGEQKFESVAALEKQIALDTSAVCDYFKKECNGQ